MNYRRVPSQNEQSILNGNDSSFMNHNNTTRSISSSSTSMISTPSNSIRKFQDEGQQAQETKGKLRTTTNLISKTKNHHLKPKKSANVNLVKNKLLNLQKSLKLYTKSKEAVEEEKNVKKVFVLRRPMNMNYYDYSIFREYPEGSEEGYSPPAVKESQIKAWESAEKITNNLIFDNDSDLSDDEEMNEGETNEDIHIDNVKPLSNLNADTAQNEILDMIKTIPGYTKGELEIIGKRYLKLQKLNKLNEYNPKLFEDEEKKLLYKSRQEQQMNQSKIFNQYQSLTGKRKIQVSQKKDLLNKIFGYNNTLNHEYITNNTSYSSLENVMNISKAFQEDKEEINQLLNEDKEFLMSLDDARSQLAYSKNSILNNLDEPSGMKKNRKSGELDYDKFQQLIQNKLTNIYDNGIFNDNDDFDNFAITYLRRCIKHEENNDNDI